MSKETMLDVTVYRNVHGSMMSIHPFLVASVNHGRLLPDPFNREQVLVGEPDQILTDLAAKWEEDFEHVRIRELHVDKDDLGYALLLALNDKDKIEKPKLEGRSVYVNHTKVEIPLNLRVWMAYNVFIHHAKDVEVLGVSDGALMLRTCGMVVGIEPDGYTHS